MTLDRTTPTPTSPWTGRLHLALTLTLIAAALSIAGLAAAGRVRFGETVKADAPEVKSRPKGEEGRYQIEKVSGVHEILDRAGKSFFDTETYDTWAFEYRGGLVEATLETDVEGQPVKVAAVPAKWNLDSSLQKTLVSGSEGRVDFNGFILVTARRIDATVAEMLEPYHPHLGGSLAFGSLGPLQVVPSLFLEVRRVLPYRVFLSASPPESSSGGGFNLWEEKPVLISTPLVIQNPALEEARSGGGKNLQPGKEELILDRRRGYSRIRLKARFLTDGEARELMPK